MALVHLVDSIAGFQDWTPTEKIKLFTWHLHTFENREIVARGDISRCFDALSLPPPSSLSGFLSSLSEQRKPALIKVSGGYKLERSIRLNFENRFAQRPVTIHVHKLLADLPKLIPMQTEREFLEETLVCLRSGAFRAAIVMAWNLAYDNLCQRIVRSHLAVFNVQFPKSFPKEAFSVSKRDDLEEIKESRVLQICSSASIITPSLFKVLKEKLDRRNIAAHPSGIRFSQLTAEEYVRDLVENVVLKF